MRCALTLTAVLALFGMVAWASGIASPGDLPWILAGAFGGSFVRATFQSKRSAADRPR